MKFKQSSYLQPALRSVFAMVLAAATMSITLAAPRKLLPGHLPALAPNLQPLGRLDPGTRLRLSIGLPLRDQPALTDLLARIYDPASPLYHRYLTPDEFAARFGPTERDYAAVVAFAASNGFKILAQHPNRLRVEVSGAVPDIERAFQVTLRTYRHPSEERILFGPDTEPSVASDIPILSIGGLHNFARPRPANLHHAPIARSASASAVAQIGSGANGNLAGLDFRAAYVPGVSFNGTGQQIGLVEFDGYYGNDIASYVSQTGLTNVPLSVVLLDDFSGRPTRGPDSGNSEVALDIEMAISMAPALSQVVVYEAGPNGQLNDVLQALSANTAIKQFSCSWASPSLTSAEQTNMDNYFRQFAAQGQSFFCASGDSGAYSGAITPPDDDPYITLVGGTTLATAGPGGPFLSESAWNPGDGPGSGTSGGVSTLYAIPAWQQGVKMTANGGSTTKRNLPDVAMVADNIFIVADDGYTETAGGTSLASPLWAGFAALVNQRAAASNQPTIGFVNPALYHLGTNQAYGSCFYDVTVGNNTNSNAGQYFAVPGFDLCTGWGSPNGGSLLAALTRPDGFQITPGHGGVGNGPVGGPFTLSAQVFLLTNSGASAFKWALGTTSTWVTVSSTGGTLAPATAATAVTVSVNAAASGLPAGVYTANLSFTNLASGQVQLRQFSLQLGQDLVLDGGFEAEDFCYWTLTGPDDVYTNDFVDNGTVTEYSAEAGNCFAAMGEAGTLAYLSQSLPTHPGQAYQLSFWLANPEGYSSGPNQFQVQWNTNASAKNIIFIQVNMGAFDWSNKVFTVVAATDTTTLCFGFQNDNDYFLLDSVSVTPLPSPAFQSVGVVNGALRLTFSAVPGLQYQVQSATSLTSPNWANVGGAVTATANPMTVSETLGRDAARYYRILGP